MANTPGNWIEPPPGKRTGLGCFAKGVIVLILLALLFVVGVYFFLSHGIVSVTPKPLPVEELAPDALQSVQQRVQDFKEAPVATPAPTVAPVETTAPDATPFPTPAPAATGKELNLSASEINGLIAANRKSRGHAFVTLSGNTATVQVSVPSDKVPGVSKGYLNGTFQITTDGPTPIDDLRVSKIRANGYPMPSGVLSMNVGGQSVLSYALSGAAPYNVSTAEVRDGHVILH